MFEPALLPMAQKLHQRSDVKTTTNFDGNRYVVSKITME
jgi:hypothetical protein